MNISYTDEYMEIVMIIGLILYKLSQEKEEGAWPPRAGIIFLRDRVGLPW